MKFIDTLRGLLRRWYILLPGIIVAASLTIGMWYIIPPGYYRSSTQLLLPGASSVPVGANPYLFLGGLAPAADVLVRAIGSENVLNEMAEDHPGVEIKISRDTTTAGPIILIAVTASSDADAREVLGLLVERTATVLEDFQQMERIPAENRMTVIPVTIDKQSVLQQRTRLLGVAGAAIGGIVLTVFIAGLVDGLSQQRKRAASASDGENSTEEGDDADESVTTEENVAIAEENETTTEENVTIADEDDPADENLTTDGENGTTADENVTTARPV